MSEDKKTCSFGPESAYVDLATEVFRLLSDPTRIRIILALRDHGELSVNRLAEIVGKTPTTTSQHLAKLRWGRIVGVRQDGTRMFYQLVDDRARELVALAVFQAERVLEGSSAHERAGVSPSVPGEFADEDNEA
ncbi:winged helix-turn-helix transcriptional regulator [Mycolicibacterium wolinskyi]|uniref:ArsR family transcriptional regulator n=1 Tax=Mycolicibacterium wolinskyi TaxID=59750 RepID=A0A1X2FJ92_9MYCO|nr:MULTISPECIES: metalloregulator ArsR/SmtB family transcription factor [Mycolicibacterium]MCV7290177.1 winged helix-turn-helix transcriptional regulator [Mycolicibacterium wolinskyi]MCV7292889.1 winged helix-turn-helix transcriptional regulator [Mycolicibacterium goodii]ORX18039.1 ArsR family transcriptional regulator [Mycolicibacterium wolinskyi]